MGPRIASSIQIDIVKRSNQTRVQYQWNQGARVRPRNPHGVVVGETGTTRVLKTADAFLPLFNNRLEPSELPGLQVIGPEHGSRGKGTNDTPGYLGLKWQPPGSSFIAVVSTGRVHAKKYRFYHSRSSSSLRRLLSSFRLSRVSVLLIRERM
ncbi:hypothetical protein BDN72DRAFT_850380 [Pluteus cervinus]|uniref:Uncharacterized protein n=1 Tax=Pluteus cervinus TaxID=181527 RepID=A0ACD3A4G2_9AGAR|nr:hypothetical protein BDN72DRAFT_850380 [Pluteus cervinus]